LALENTSMQHSDPRSHRGGGLPGRIEPEMEATAGRDQSGRSPGSPAYAVGYGKPPPGSRFQPGRSGNPKGRPRGDQAFKTLLRRELEQRVSIKEQGRRRKLSKRSVIVKRLVGEAMAGNPKHLAIVLAQDPIVAEVLDEVTAALTRPADAFVKADLIRRLREAAELERSPPDRADPPEPVREGGGA